MRLKSKSAIVTGAGRGIGKAIAKRFLEEGARVFICDLSAERVESSVSELSKYGEIQGLPIDVSDPCDVDRLIEVTVNCYNRIDILANNAGVAKFNDFIHLRPEDWDKTMAVNVKGQFLVSQAAAKVMIKQQSGVIINMASTNGVFGEAKLVDYNVSKAGVILLSKTMAIELAPYNIRVNSVCPGFILTELALEGGMSKEEVDGYLKKIPLGRGGSPLDVANVFSFLASDDASFITGTEIIIDGGQTCQE